MDVSATITATTADEAATFYDGNEPLSAEPVSSLRDLETQVTLALGQGVKELEVTKEVMSQLLRGSYSDTNNSIIYKNVWLFEVGKAQQTKEKLNENLNRRLHGKSGLKGRS